MASVAPKALAAGGAAVLAAAALVAGDRLTPFSSSQELVVTQEFSRPMKVCGDFNQYMTDGECFAAGTLRFVFFHNEQGAAQFCKWRAANPGEWSRIQEYAKTSVEPANIVTWQGGALVNALQAYLITGAPTFTIPPNTAPNACRTPIPPPVVSGVTPGQTDATVTIETGG